MSFFLLLILRAPLPSRYSYDVQYNSQNALVGRSHFILAFHFPFDERFEEIEEDLKIPAH